MCDFQDPWIRNEVWRYDRANYPTGWSNKYAIKITFLRGFKIGLAAAILTSGMG